MVLSLSKLSVYVTLGLSVYVVTGNNSTVEVASALMSNLGAIANYAYRRRKQVETGTGGYAGGLCDDLEGEGV
ncbi:hypothetical protein SAMN06297144_1885 [Sphingomonas guangdongensis]|uniref:Uncharacterized protein n=1 Tax=Sphingomonas guangdongensis TaxID=1141890 RepID=A0A285QY74_9SPHN|nr:hypothetical protein [Sphingomonas guangdongensis]SOB86776.1 hypothetical protein SAMN06297144_1885 [Sphingomonas guangdongensis]